jgi:hypothetical protein
MSEEDQHYLVTMECRAAIAFDIRAQLVEAVTDVPDLQFTELDSAFITDSGRVDVTATVSSHHRRELALEAIVARFAGMDGVVRASWRRDSQGS